MILVCAPADEIADDKTDPERKHQRSCEIVFHEFFGFLRRLRGIVPGAAILAARALADAMRKLVHVVTQFFELIVKIVDVDILHVSHDPCNFVYRQLNLPETMRRFAEHSSKPPESALRSNRRAGD